MSKKTTATAGEAPFTESVPALGKRLLGLGRQSAYAAARRGEIPTVKIGGKLRGLTRVLEARLARDPQNNLKRIAAATVGRCRRQASPGKPPARER